MSERFVLRGADVIDGTGAPAQRLDVAVEDGRITALGDLPSASGLAEIDCSGLVLAPGFLDIHTHLDAQVLWDPDLSPSPQHGVTTVLMGNCGFGLAPTRPEHRGRILEVLRAVEDMDPAALEAGVRWEFETFAEYLALLDRVPKRIDVAAYLGHTPLRVYVMGDAAFERDSTAGERAAMHDLAREALAAGAFGLATSRAANHVCIDGRPVPSFVAGIEELEVLGRALAAHGKGVLQIARGDLPIAELGRISAQLGIVISWSSLLTGRPFQDATALELLEQTQKAGGRVWAQIACRPITIQIRLANPIALNRFDCMRRVLATAEDEREPLLRSEAWRRAAREEMNEAWRTMWAQTRVLLPGFEDPTLGVPLGRLADEGGTTFVDAMLDTALDHGIATTRFSIPVANDDEAELTALLNAEGCMLGLSDAGAHANQQCDASYSTHLLGHWVREQGALPLERAVWRLTGQPAEIFGFDDRGLIRAGRRADLVAFDPRTVGALPYERVRDLPGGADRIVSRSSGVEHVWVAGVAIRRNGHDCEDVAPGRVVRRA